MQRVPPDAVLAFASVTVFFHSTEVCLRLAGMPRVQGRKLPAIVRPGMQESEAFWGLSFVLDKKEQEALREDVDWRKEFVLD